MSLSDPDMGGLPVVPVLLADQIEMQFSLQTALESVTLGLSAAVGGSAVGVVCP